MWVLYVCVITGVCVLLHRGWTPLHRASEEGHTDTARVLVERGADLESRDEEWVYWSVTDLFTHYINDIFYE